MNNITNSTISKAFLLTYALIMTVGFAASQIVIHKMQKNQDKMYELTKEATNDSMTMMDKYSNLLTYTKEEMYFHVGVMDCVEDSKDFRTLTSCIKVEQTMYDNGKYSN